MRIAFFHNLPGGGSVRVLKDVTDYLKGKGWNVDVYCVQESKNNNWVSTIWKNETRITIVNPWKTFLGRLLWIFIVLPRVHKGVAQRIDRLNYDRVIVTHDYFTKSPYLLRYIKTKNIYILHEPQREFYENSKYHAPYIKDKIANLLRLPIKWVDSKNVSNADCILANSKYSQKVINYVYKRKAIIVYPGVNIDHFKPGLPKENILLYVGGISKVKGYDFVVKSLLPLLGDYRLVMIGDGRTKDVYNLYKLAGAKIKYIKLLPHVDEKELIEWYQKSKLLCIGAYREPFGLTSIEAQACGTPVVCINEGGVPETINPNNTGLISDRDEKQYLNKVVEILNKDSSISNNCRSWVINKWSWNQSFSKIARILAK